MTRRPHRAVVTVLLAIGPLLLVAETAVAQCAMCRSAFASPEGQQLVAAFRAGILFLLAAPFASFAAVAFLAVRRQRRRTAASFVVSERGPSAWAKSGAVAPIDSPLS